jgi:hypothetical protein
MISYLDAINYVLAQVGSAPVTDDQSLQPDVQTAILRLSEASTWLQKRGWWWNTDLNVTLPLNVNDKIPLPANTMKILKAYPEFVTNRDGFAYSPHRQTDIFDGALYVDIVIEQPWDYMPPSAVDAIRHRAAKQMVLIQLEDYNKADRIEADYLEAMLELNKDDMSIKRRSLFASPTVQQRRSGVRPVGGRRNGSINPNIPGG